VTKLESLGWAEEIEKQKNIIRYSSRWNKVVQLPAWAQIPEVDQPKRLTERGEPPSIHQVRSEGSDHDSLAEHQ
jgi:hypothetical protein